MIKVSDNKIETDFEVLEDFFRSVDLAVHDKDIIYISVDSGELSMYSEDKYDGMSAGVFVSMKVPVTGTCEDFSFGINAGMAVSFFKKLYAGPMTIKLKKNKKGESVEFKKDNIKATFAIVAKKRRISIPNFTKINGATCDWVVSGVGDCLAAIAETSKKAACNTFSGILLDTKGPITRICKFTQVSFFIKSGNAIFISDNRTILPDNLAKLCKSFNKTVRSILLSPNLAGIELENGTIVAMPAPHDTYPSEYSSHLSLPGGALTEDSYVFDPDAVFAAVELVSSALGDTESWITFKIIGQSGNELVWEISGKSHKGVEVSEKVTSSQGPIIEGMQLNKERLMKSLKIFKDKLYVYNLSPSVLLLTDEEGLRLSMLVKARL